jgi:hypothetical protein
MASIRLRYFISVAVMRLHKLARSLSKIGSDRPVFFSPKQVLACTGGSGKHQTTQPVKHKVLTSLV